MMNLSNDLEFHPPASNKLQDQIDDYYYDFPLQFTPQSSFQNTPPLSLFEDELLNHDSSISKKLVESSPVYFGETKKSNQIFTNSIADKLMQKQNLANKRIKDLRAKKEQEELKNFRNKPKISKRSQELARLAEQKLFKDVIRTNRLFGVYSPIRNQPIQLDYQNETSQSPKISIQTLNSIIKPVTLKQAVDNQSKKTENSARNNKLEISQSVSARSFSVSRNRLTSPVKSYRAISPHKSLLNLSVIERNDS